MAVMKDQVLPEIYRNDFPALNRLRNEKPPVYFDNACTTLVPWQVINIINQYYTDFPACGGGRSSHWFAEEVNARIEGSQDNGDKGVRQSIADFVNAGSDREIVFTLNTTHAINLVALGFRFNPGDVVLLTDREHNSNLLPWLRLQDQGLIKVEHISPGDENGFDLDALERRLKQNHVRLVSFSFTSNATGETLPAKEIITIAHRYGARVLLDGAQTVPHHAVDVRDLDVDFLAFSIHKMCGPRGVGVLYGKMDLLEQNDHGSGCRDDAISPVILGGGTILNATYDSYQLLDAPQRFEAGISDYPGLIAAKTAVAYLRQIGMDRIAAHERCLNGYMTDVLSDRYNGLGWFQILGPQDAHRRGGILSFEIRRPNALGIAKELNAKNNIMIRDGVFCAHAYFNDRYGIDWTRPKSHHDHRMIYRVSLYLYNTLDECDVFLDTLDEILKERSYL